MDLGGERVRERRLARSGRAAHDDERRCWNPVHAARSIIDLSPFGHIDLRVADLDAAFAFYETLLPALGFTATYHSDAWKVWASPEGQYVALTESSGHVANENRIAFRLASNDEVDRLAAVARDAGAVGLSGPKPMPYGPGYYAAYFDDPSGNRLELYVRPG